MTTSSLSPESRKAAEAIGKGCGTCIGRILWLVTAALAIAYTIKHNPF